MGEGACVGAAPCFWMPRCRLSKDGRLSKDDHLLGFPKGIAKALRLGATQFRMRCVSSGSSLSPLRGANKLGSFLKNKQDFNKSSARVKGLLSSLIFIAEDTYHVNA